MTTPLENQIIVLARQSDCLAEVCDLVEYDPNIGRVPEHWRVKVFFLDIARKLATKPPAGEQKPVGYVCPSRLADLKAGRCTAINLVSEEEAQLLDLPGHGYPDIPVYTAPHPEQVAQDTLKEIDEAVDALLSYLLTEATDWTGAQLARAVKSTKDKSKPDTPIGRIVAAIRAARTRGNGVEPS